MALAVALSGRARSVAQHHSGERPRIEIADQSWSDGSLCEPPEITRCLHYTTLSFEGFPAVSRDGSIVAYRVHGGELHEVTGITFQRTGPGHIAPPRGLLPLRSMHYGGLGSQAYLRVLARDIAAVRRRLARGGFRTLRAAHVEHWRSEERAFRRPEYAGTPLSRHYYRVRARDGGPVLFDVSEITPLSCAGGFWDVGAWIDVRTRVVMTRWHHAYCDGCTDAYVDRAEPWPGPRGSTPWAHQRAR